MTASGFQWSQTAIFTIDIFAMVWHYMQYNNDI